jgi:hypothetical protein
MLRVISILVFVVIISIANSFFTEALLSKRSNTLCYRSKRKIDVLLNIMTFIFRSSQVAVGLITVMYLY